MHHMMLKWSLGENMFVKCSLKQVLEMVIEMKNEKNWKWKFIRLFEYSLILFVCNDQVEPVQLEEQLNERGKKMWTMCICNFLFFSIHICDSTSECFTEVNI